MDNYKTPDNTSTALCKSEKDHKYMFLHHTLVFKINVLHLGGQRSLSEAVFINMDAVY